MVEESFTIKSDRRPDIVLYGFSHERLYEITNKAFEVGVIY